MHHFTFLSVLLSFGAFAASVSADLPYVVSNTTAGYEERIDLENDSTVENMRKYFVRTDGVELEPRDIICDMYSELGNIDASFRSNPLSLDALFNDKANSKSFRKTLDSLEHKCHQDALTHMEECLAGINALLLMDMVLNSNEVNAFYTQKFPQTKETVTQVLTKPEMCGEGWKHGEKYLKLRMPWSFEKKGSPVIQIPV
ncbi:hypothetical protein NCS52_00967100 [Fusarium sp. LHS14.1]|nr:hypothetical protein NCS52_00967100 [Fusarium sp. LHS14.1]